jgi:hypothetical protein
MSWREKLNALKNAASTQTQSTTADARKILDKARKTIEEIEARIPDVRTGAVTRDDVESFYASARSLGIDPRPPTITAHGWLLSLSRVATTDGKHTWHLSASLHPTGRSGTVNDWKMLGHFAIHLGAQRNPMIMPEDPTRAIHWRWREAA